MIIIWPFIFAFILVFLVSYRKDWGLMITAKAAVYMIIDTIRHPFIGCTVHVGSDGKVSITHDKEE